MAATGSGHTWRPTNPYARFLVRVLLFNFFCVVLLKRRYRQFFRLVGIKPGDAEAEMIVDGQDIEAAYPPTFNIQEEVIRFQVSSITATYGQFLSDPVQAFA